MVEQRHNYNNVSLNVFKGVDLGNEPTGQWKVKRDIEWEKNCPLPTDEVFMQYKE